MLSFFSKRIVLTGVVFLALGLGLFLMFGSRHAEKTLEPVIPVASVLVQKEVSISPYRVIGSSVEGRKIEAYTYGSGKTHLIFAGGMHGGYEWNSVLLAYKFIDYLKADPEVIPKNLTITVIPSLNPDGVYKVIGKEGRFEVKDVPTEALATVPGRFNAHKVDLNRNFDCKWKPTSMWQGKTVSAGTAPFSEPEAKDFRNFVLENKPSAVVFWHSMSGAVYASECKNGILPQTLDIMNTYSKASGYSAVKKFDAYEVTGDSEGWLASINIPAITVELKTHESIEWDKNLAGIEAVFKYYAREKRTAQ